MQSTSGRKSRLYSASIITFHPRKILVSSLTAIYATAIGRKFAILYKMAKDFGRVHPFDRELGIKTSTVIGDHILYPKLKYNAKGSKENHPYAGCVTDCVRTAIKFLPQTSSFVFYDLGCGMGRALFIASEFNFARIVGIELSEELCAIARKNSRAMARRFPARPEVSIQNINALDLNFSEPQIVIFMYSPFGLSTTKEFVRHLERAVVAGSKIYVIFENPVYGHVFDKSDIFSRRFAKQVPIPNDERNYHFDQTSEAIAIWASTNIEASTAAPDFEINIGNSGNQATIVMSEV